MVRGYNKVILVGNLTRDPELRYTPNNTAVADLGLAVNRTYQNSQGEMQEDTTFVDITVWGRNAENCSQYLAKGRPALVEGRLTFDSWENQQGERRTKLKVTAQRVDFLGTGGGEGATAPAASQPSVDESPEEILDNVEVEGTEDDIPF